MASLPKSKLDLYVLMGFAVLSLLYYPFSVTILTTAIAIVVFFATGSYTSATGVFVAMIFLRWLGSVLQPTVVAARPALSKAFTEGFAGQAVSRLTQGNAEGFSAAPKDPVSIHQRLVGNKRPQPLNPKVAEVTGVLASAEILDNLPLAQLSPEETGAAAAGSVAPVGSQPPIPTPVEGFVARRSTETKEPASNPYLHNGPDYGAVNTALSRVGAEVAEAADEVHGTTLDGPAPVE